MFSVEEYPKGRLDLKENFQTGKGLCSFVGIFKSVSLLTTLGIMLHHMVIHPAPLSFYPAYLTSWGMFFSICYLSGSFLLTTRHSSAVITPDANNRLIKFTWVLFSLSSVWECVIAVLYWSLRPAKMGPILLENVTTHGVIVPILLVQGLLVDHIPSRLKHCSVAVLFGILYLSWLAIQNVAIRYNPLDNGDDDAIYDGFRWRNEPIQTLKYSLIIVFAIVPAFAVLIWALSLRGRRYLDKPGEEEESSVVEEFDEEIEGSNWCAVDDDIDEADES
ncbi:unnamed protein product [Cylindrotheca closterium]|uniref:Uncharacterized protein n=1 Tax=Cylindrotheca closterium TaxID=2856 RepID=A0AAD2FGP7_9STRA|nr:unnamed protein product [Cylindrotheca closterium]